MRELKFRFVDTGDGTVYKPIALVELCQRIEIPRRIVLESENGEFVDTDDFLDQLENGELICEQYTGLKDKNGKEIYEGDIVKAGGRIYEVAWLEKDGGWFCFTEDDYHTPLYHLEAEVIGNIHENPELLMKNNGRG